MNTLLNKVSQSQLATLMGFRRKRKKLKELTGDIKLWNHDVFLSFKKRIRSCENRQNYRLIQVAMSSAESGIYDDQDPMEIDSDGEVGPIIHYISSDSESEPEEDPDFVAEADVPLVDDV